MTFKDFYYDYDKKILRYEMPLRDEYDDDGNLILNPPTKFVSDYNIAIQYAIDEVTGKCQIRPIRYNDLGEDYSNELSSEESLIIMKTPESIIYYDANYSFTGKRETNGIRSDRYIGSIFNAMLETVYEYSFSDVGLRRRFTKIKIFK